MKNVRLIRIRCLQQPSHRTVDRVGAENGFKFIDFNAGNAPNNIASFDKARVLKVRCQLDETGLQLGIHLVSAINNAEYVPIMSEAVDDYLTANLKLIEAIGAG